MPPQATSTLTVPRVGHFHFQIQMHSKRGDIFERDLRDLAIFTLRADSNQTGRRFKQTR